MLAVIAFMQHLNSMLSRHIVWMFHSLFQSLCDCRGSPVPSNRAQPPPVPRSELVRKPLLGPPLGPLPTFWALLRHMRRSCATGSDAGAMRAHAAYLSGRITWFVLASKAKSVAGTQGCGGWLSPAYSTVWRWWWQSVSSSL